MTNLAKWLAIFAVFLCIIGISHIYVVIFNPDKPKYTCQPPVDGVYLCLPRK